MTPRVENAGAAGGHIVMLPFMAHGHLIPFLSLPRILHSHTDFTITLDTTPLNDQYLRSTVSAFGRQRGHPPC
ncbi:hypothetical protein SAY86_026483 [Trapa natans]|uniref:Uncharacterized protein n=1 Tax=Trapa natans TaxID=22666 RepID=A0AAN7QF30_TRANT|nr:hypothetical protein SAY86_025746 [Trapa natans]KAK4765393.1 hypothetical protein SAY86_026483 [Trapa natans]